MSSFTRINYKLRYAKNIERKMVFTALQPLELIHPLQRYQYIGFGSLSFVDFELVHKYFGITNLVSIERDESSQARFEFNRPYKCVELRFGDSNDVLPTCDWSKSTIGWLDYDGQLSDEVLSDVNTFFSNARSGSVFLITINAHPLSADGITGSDLHEKRMKDLLARVGQARVPAGVTGKDLSMKHLPTVYQTIVDNEIQDSLTNRNLALTPEEQFEYSQLFNFRYKDGAAMMTLGGILYNKKDRKLVVGMRLDRTPFARTASEPFHLTVPLLTEKESSYLNRMLPSKRSSTGVSKADVKRAQKIGISTEDLADYNSIYRYYPSFHEAV